MNRARRLAMMLAWACCLAICGCATRPAGDAHSIAQGWRAATVTRVATGAHFMNLESWFCGRGTPEQQRAATRYALVTYRQFGLRQESLVALPEQLALHAGDAVWLRLGRCENAIEPRSGRAGEH